MKSRLIFLISVTLVSLLCTGAWGQEAAVVLKYRGADGKWFPDAMVDQMQVDILELEAFRKKKPELDIKLELNAKRIDELNIAVVATTKALEITKGAVAVAESAMDESAERTVAAEERALEAERKMNAWYRHPVTLVGAGAIVVIIIEVVIYAVVK